MTGSKPKGKASEAWLIIAPRPGSEVFRKLVPGALALSLGILSGSLMRVIEHELLHGAWGAFLTAREGSALHPGI